MKWRVWGNKTKDREEIQIDKLPYVSIQLQTLGLHLHGYSWFIGFKGLFFLEKLAWAAWMYRQPIYDAFNEPFTHNLMSLHKQPKLRIRYISSTCTWTQRRCTQTPSNVHARWSVCLCRIQSSYAALQRINQDLEDKMHRTVRSSHTTFQPKDKVLVSITFTWIINNGGGGMQNPHNVCKVEESLYKDVWRSTGVRETLVLVRTHTRTRTLGEMQLLTQNSPWTCNTKSCSYPGNHSRVP